MCESEKVNFNSIEGLTSEQMKSFKRTQRFLKDFQTPLGRLRHMTKNGKMLYQEIPDVLKERCHSWRLLDSNGEPLFMIMRQGRMMGVVRRRQIGGVIMNDIYEIDRRGLKSQQFLIDIPNIDGEKDWTMVLDGRHPSSRDFYVSVDRLNRKARPEFRKGVWNVIYEIEKQLMKANSLSPQN